MTTVTINNTSLSLIDSANGFFIGRAEIDNDGPGPSQNDPDHQDETSTRDPNGNSLDASVVPFVALPEWMMRKFGPAVKGCLCQVVDLVTMTMADAVVGDVAPKTGYGEMSPPLADAFKIPDSPTTGGVNVREFLYRIYAGQGALINGVQYSPQSL